METLSQQDFQTILSFVQRLYSTDSLQNVSSYIATTISHLIRVDIAGYCTLDLKHLQFLDGVLFPAFPVQPDLMNQYFHEHPHHKHYINTRDCQARKVSDFLSEQQLHQQEGLYQKFLRPMHMEEQMSLVFPQTDWMTIDAIALFRSQRNFTERDRLMLNLLLPHFTQARQTEQVFAQLQRENRQLQDSLTATGHIIISEQGDVQFMTSKAENWLQQYFSYRKLGRSLPEHLRQWLNYQQSLHHHTSTIPKPHLPLKLEKDGKQLVIRYVADPANHQHILLLEEQRSPSLTTESLQYIGLSKREAEVLFWVAKGKENREIAKILTITPVTVRKHLERIYQKLEVTSRAAAIVTALQKLGML